MLKISWDQDSEGEPYKVTQFTPVYGCCMGLCSDILENVGTVSEKAQRVTGRTNKNRTTATYFKQIENHLKKKDKICYPK
jgi:hypothetical protein